MSGTASRATVAVKATVLVAVVGTMAALLGVIGPLSAEAAGTVLFHNLFNNRTVDGIGTVTVPTPVFGTNTACLTAAGNSATLPLLSCAGAPDAQGNGKLRLTNSGTNQVGAVFGQSSFPTSNGLDVTFTAYQWGGGGADGMGFLLAAVDPVNPAAPAGIGPSGGSLGYSPAGSVRGLPNAYLGVGLDVFGNFSSNGYSGSGCTNPAPISVRAPEAVVVRGPGNGLVGYCGLTSTFDGTTGSRVTLRAATRAASAVPVQVLINPTAAPFTSDSGVSVAAGAYKVVVTPVGQTARTLTGPLPAVAAGLYPSTSWVSANGVPKQLAFGFVGSTGSVTDVHEISDAKVLTFNPVPQLAVATTSYAPTTSQPGQPVNYTAVAQVLPGANVTSAITLVQTVPSGVAAAGAYGSGWVCQPRVEQTITCVTSATSFANGTVLPTVTVVGIVTVANLSAAVVQSNSPTRVSSADGSPGTDAATTTGVVPAAPIGVSVYPAIGPIAGGNLVSVFGYSTASPTAIEIGTAAEQQAGTPVVLLPCPAGRAAGCFTVEGNTFVIQSMPARATPATVTVTVVTLGVAAAATYVYAAAPTTPAAPTATAGISSATVAWTPPAANGSPITSYTVVTYRAGVVQQTQVFDTSTTTRVIPGLTPAESYTFTVAATNGYGTSAPSAMSAAAVPYALPGAPAITAVTAGSQSAVLTWTPAAPNGSAITGYVVTPYIGAVAQPTQTFAGTATTRSVTGLTAGTAYTFRVAAQNLAGTGPMSAASSAVTPNVSPSLGFPAPPSGQVGVAYSAQLTVTAGTAPFAWSVSSGTLPAGLTLNPSTGLLSGTPTTASSSTFTVRVTDASGQTATRSITLVIAASPVMTFTPAAGEVGVAYSRQPTIAGGTGPFAWTVGAGVLPAGITLNPSTGLLSGTPTVAGSAGVTITATDAFGQTASRTVTLEIVARPAFAATVPPTGQVGVTYSHRFDVTGGSLPLTWAITAGSLPAGLTFDPATGLVSGVPSTVGSFPFTIQVTDANAQTDTRAVTLTIAAGPLVITKAANVSSAAPGSVVRYTITVVNTGGAGGTAFTGVSLSDPLAAVLDDATYNADVTATAGSATYTAPTLGWTGDVAAGATVTISYSVTVRDPATGNKVLTNTVTSPTVGANCAGGAADARCTTTVTVPGLTIVKSSDVTTTTPGSVVRFTIVVTNAGQTPYPSATLADGLGDVLDDATYNADATATAGNLSYTAPSLTWTGPLAVGASVTITYTLTVDDPDLGNRSLAGTVVSPSAGSPCPGGNPAPQCTVAVTVLVPALSITNVADGATTTPGGVVAYTVTLANTGQTAYTATTVTVALAAALDDATYNSDAAATGGVVAFDAPSSSLVWTGNLAVGATITITASVTVRDPDPGDKTLTTVAGSTAPGSTCAAGANPGCTSVVQVRVPALSITTTAGAATTTPGSVVVFTVSATNTGQTPYAAATFSQALGEALDDAAYNGDADATAGGVSVNDSTLTWTGALLVGATATVTYSMTVTDPAVGDRELRSTVTSATAGSNCPTAGTDPRCSSTVTVLLPGLTLESATDGATTTPGSIVRYTLTVTNTGQTAYTGLAVTLGLAQALDDADYNFDATISTGNLVTSPDGHVDWVLTLAPGASAVGSLTMTVKNPATGDRALRVSVVADAPGSPCPAGSAVETCHTVVTVLIPGLTVTKTADRSTVSPGGAVTYTISVTNDGQTSYPAASFADDLTAVLTDAIYAGGATATIGVLSYDAPVLSWTGPLAPGATATISYTVTVRDPAPGDKQLRNTVTSAADGANCPAGGADPRCTAVVSVLVPALTIVTTATTPTTAPGAVVGYTVTVTNSGPTGYAAASFVASLTDAVDDATYNDDAAAGAGTVGLAGSNLTWTGPLAIGATVVVTWSVTVHAADDGDDLVTNVVTSTTSGANCVAGGTDARCTVTVPVARLILWQGVAEATATPGSLITLTASYTNTGQVPYYGITVVSPRGDTADDTIPTGDQTASSGTIVRTPTELRWTGDIPVGAVVTTWRTLRVQNPDPGNGRVTATIVSTAPGNNCQSGTTDPRCTFLVTVLTPALTITKVADTTWASPGDVVGYTITVVNSGQTPYVGAELADPLVGTMENASYGGDATASAGTLDFTAPTLTWIGDLAVGATVVISYSLVVDATPSGDLTLFNSVSSSTVGSTCPPATGNQACLSYVNILVPMLTIEKTAAPVNATLGAVVVYTITATNAGQTTYDPAELTDDLADVLDDATYNGDATADTGTGTLDDTGGTLRWSGPLAPGAKVTITYSVTIDNPATGDLVMAGAVTSTSDGSNCAEGSADPRCAAVVQIVDAVALTFTKTTDVRTTVRGAVVTYTVTVVNSTDSAIDDVTFTDPLADVLDDATYNGDATADGGVVTFTDPDLTWIGTAPALGSVTVTYSVTVHATETGDQVLDGTIDSASLPGSTNCEAAGADPRCTSTVPIAALLIEQSAGAPTAAPGTLITLTATYTNTGAVPYYGISISSPRADTSDDTIPTGDQSADSGVIVRTATALVWTGDIPVGDTVTMTRTLLVQDPPQGNLLVRATVGSTADGDNCQAGTTDPLCDFLVTVVVPALTIVKVADTDEAAPGSTVGYTVTVDNTGDTPYTAAEVTDSLAGLLDDAVYDGNAVADVGSITFTTPELRWTGDLEVGEIATITYSVTVRPTTTGDKAMVNAVSSATTGNTCPPASGNTACTVVVLVLTPLLAVTTTASVATTAPGASVTHTITATNTGQAPYTGITVTVALDGVLDDASVDGDPTATAGTVQIAAGALTWTGDLALAAAVTITYTVTVDQPVTGDFLLEQTAVSNASGSTCPTDGADARCATSTPIAGLLIVNTADVATTGPTAVVRNTVTFTNIGQVPYVGLSITDDFSGSLDDAVYNGDATATAGSLLLVTGTGRIVWTGDLGIGDTVVVTGTLTVRNPDPGNKIMTTVVSTDDVGSNCPVGGIDAACRSSVTVLTPALTIAKVADAAVVTPGATIGYTITVTNTGEAAYTGAVVTDNLGGVLDDATYNDDAATDDGGDLSYTAPNLAWTGGLAVGASVVITYSVEVGDPDLGDKLVVNDVTSGAIGSSCAVAGSGPPCSAVTMVLVPALDLTLAADRTTTVPGDSVGYTVTIHNAGQTAYTAISVTALLAGVLDDATYDDDAEATAGTVAIDGDELTWTGDLAIDATVVVTYGVTVTDPDLGNLSLVTAVQSAAQGSTCGSVDPCTNTVTVLVPGLAVSTTADVATATPGDAVTFTITVVNTGQTPYPEAAVGTTLAGVLDDAEFDGEITASAGVPSYLDPNLTWAGGLQVGESAVISYTVIVRNPTPGDRVLSTTVVSPAAGSTCQAGSGDPGCTATVTVLIPALEISKSAGAPTTTPGSDVEYTILVTNSGETPYDDVVVADPLDGVLTDAVYNGDAVVTAGGGTLAYVGTTIVWTGDLLVGASATIIYSITVDDPDTGDKNMVNTVVSDAAGSTCPTGGAAAACSVTVRVLVPALTVTKAADAAIVVAGSAVGYTLTVTNTGETAYAPAVLSDPLTDVLDDASYADDAEATSGEVVYADGTVTWTGALAVGATATITYSVTADHPATGDRTLVNAVRSSSPGASCATGAEAQCASTVIVLSPALDITKTADTSEVVAGDTVSYTITATNTGQADYAAATFADALAGVLDDAVYNDDAEATGGTVERAGDSLVWTGGLPTGATVLVTYSVTTAVTGDGDAVLVNAVTSTTIGSTCPAPGSGPGCATSTPIADRTISLTDLTASFVLAGVPDSLVGSDGAVTMTVTTNSSGGYVVTVRAMDPSLTGGAPANIVTIPIALLGVRENGELAFRPLSVDTPLVVHRQDEPSGPAGDAVSNDYQIQIPFVPSDTYSTTLEYIVSAR